MDHIPVSEPRVLWKNANFLSSFSVHFDFARSNEEYFICVLAVVEDGYACLELSAVHVDQQLVREAACEREELILATFLMEEVEEVCFITSCSLQVTKHVFDYIDLQLRWQLVEEIVFFYDHVVII